MFISNTKDSDVKHIGKQSPIRLTYVATVTIEISVKGQKGQTL